MSVEREVFEQFDFDDIINQCAAVKEKLGLKLSAEPKTLYPNNQKMPLVSDFNVFSCHFGHAKYSRIYSYRGRPYSTSRYFGPVLTLLFLSHIVTHLGIPIKYVTHLGTPTI